MIVNDMFQYVKLDSGVEIHYDTGTAARRSFQVQHQLSYTQLCFIQGHTSQVYWMSKHPPRNKKLKNNHVSLRSDKKAFSLVSSSDLSGSLHFS